MIIETPSNWTYLGFDDTYALRASSGASTMTITCNCSDGGCDPFYYDGMFGKGWGCNIIGCKGTCTATSSLAIGSPTANVNILAGGFVDLSISPVIITKGDRPLPASFEAMFESTAVQTIISGFLSTYYGAGPIPEPIVKGNKMSAPSGHEFTFVNICGRATPLILPLAAVPAGAASGSDAKCKCNKGSGCKLKTKMGGVGCKAGSCSSCSLTVSTLGGEAEFIGFGSEFTIEASAQSFNF